MILLSFGGKNSYTEIFQITDGTANPDAIGFTGDCIAHSFDDALWALPFDVPEVLQSTGSLGSGADVNMYMIVDVDNVVWYYFILYVCSL